MKDGVNVILMLVFTQKPATFLLETCHLSARNLPPFCWKPAAFLTSTPIFGMYFHKYVSIFMI